MPVISGFKITLPPGLKAPKRVINRATKAALKAFGQHWIANFLRHHFGLQAFYRYPGVYRKRSPVKEQARYWKGPPGKQDLDPAPLKSTGMSEMMAICSARTTGTSKRMKIVFEVPSYLMRLKGWGFDPERELTVINAQEEKAMLAVFDQTLEREIEQELNRR